MPRSDPGALAIALALAVLAAAGCGTGGSSTPSVLFTVQAVGSSPADGATGVRITQTVVAVRFDRDLDPASITTSTVQLLDLLALGAVVPGTVSYSAATREIRWQLTQSGLNPLQPTATVWDFARSYRLEISTRVRTAVGPRLPRAVTVEFQTEPAQLAIAGVLPAGASTTALIEPYTIFLPNNATMSAILAVTLNADVDPVTVTDTANVFVEEMTGGTPQLAQRPGARLRPCEPHPRLAHHPAADRRSAQHHLQRRARAQVRPPRTG
ncbi:MAG: hypothetical protein KatS3mg102_0252 [Planctomycetota bacterium]|nr:MAG: hypothetical protein KatS3mg102_0252 [Planctomycetota bacterium]